MCKYILHIHFLQWKLTLSQLLATCSCLEKTGHWVARSAVFPPNNCMKPKGQRETMSISLFLYFISHLYEAPSSGSKLKRVGYTRVPFLHLWSRKQRSWLTSIFFTTEMERRALWGLWARRGPDSDQSDGLADSQYCFSWMCCWPQLSKPIQHQTSLM